ncbi:MAG: response regulator, partial [Thermodesulfovibrionales bacterium]|nr:response regulator [Thermodesulfovibrionales bacterium]
MNNISFLIVDDSKVVRSVVKTVIQTHIGSTKIYEASQATEALEIIKKTPIDIIISDWEMPGMKGDEFLYEIRNNPKTKNIPFIMMTTHGEKDFIITAIQLGVTHYLVKPFTPAELEDAIRKSWNSATKRSAPRYASLPPHAGLFKINDKLKIPFTIVNISRTGILVRLLYSDQIRLYGAYEMFMKISQDNNEEHWVIGPLLGRVVRIESDSSEPDKKDMAFVALSFDPKGIPKQVESVFLSFLKWLNGRTPNSIPCLL